MMRNVVIATLLSLFQSFSALAQTDSLRQRIERLISTNKAEVGVAVHGFESKDTLSINNSTHFPMLSVFKFHLALAVLNKVDRGKLFLNQKIPIRKEDLLPNTWSPIREKYPAGNIKLSLAELIKYTVAQSDNNGCDILLRLIGGPKTANDYIHKIGIKEVAIIVNEEEMHKDWNAQYFNWTTPTAATETLIKFYSRKILSKKSFDFLRKVMLETSTGAGRIKGQLPEETFVAHKTGTSGTNKEGLTAAINDIGIVTLPNGERFAISVFVANSKENNETNEKIISDISKLTWDHFTRKIK